MKRRARTQHLPAELNLIQWQQVATASAAPAQYKSNASQFKTLAHATATGLACVRGLSVKWRSHSSAARRGVEQAYGRVSGRTSAVHAGHLCRRAGRGSHG